MKMKHWLILAATLSAGFAAQQIFADDQPPAGPAGTNVTDSAPLPSGKKKKTAAAKKTPVAPKKTAAAVQPLKPAPVAPGPAVVSQLSVNVRGQAAINSEVIVRLKRGDKVNVIEEVTLKKPKTDEPAKWAKISLPPNAAVWVNSTFINPSDKAVVPRKLKVRSGPGENYSVVDIITKGTLVKELETKGEWMKIEPPANAYGWVAAHLLSSEPAGQAPAVVVAAVEPPKPPVTETKIANPITPAPAPDPIVPPAPAPIVVVPAAVPSVTPPTPAPAPTPPADSAAVTTPAVPAAATPPPEEIMVKRVVSREGVVKRSVSIQAPTYFTLASLDTGKTINYLFSPSTNLMIKDFTGKRIVVTGEEMLDERWPNTPVINVDTLQASP